MAGLNSSGISHSVEAEKLWRRNLCHHTHGVTVSHCQTHMVTGRYQTGMPTLAGLLYDCLYDSDLR